MRQQPRIADATATARRPVVASHTGVCGTHDTIRNLSDDQLRGIAATGGLVGIGFWDTVTGGSDAAAIARAIRYTVDLVGAEHVALGSDWDGAVPVPFDATGLVLLTEALLDDGLDEGTIRAVMGENVFRVLAANVAGAGRLTEPTYNDESAIRSASAPRFEYGPVATWA